MPEVLSDQQIPDRHDGDLGQVLLEGSGLTKRYGGVVALSDVAIRVRSGEILGLVGPNGAGKTTLVDLITGAQSADSGRLTLQGKPVTGRPARRARLGLARTFQHPLLAPELSVIDNLVVGVSARRYRSTWTVVTGLLRGIVTGPGSDYATAAAVADELGIRGLDRACR